MVSSLRDVPITLLLFMKTYRPARDSNHLIPN
jgi:hypothetical protein